MKQRAKRVALRAGGAILIFSIAFGGAVALGGCGLFDFIERDPLIREGYSFNESYGWYEKDTTEENESTTAGRTAIYNLSSTDPEMNSTYEIPNGYDTVKFVGKSTTTYHQFSIVVAGRYSDLTIELHNFKFEGKNGQAAINAMNVNSDFEVMISAYGSSSVMGGLGEIGPNGTTFDADRFDSSTNNPRSGGDGGSGDTGFPALLGNNFTIRVNQSAILTLIGGSGGNGGNGGRGEGGSMPGIGQSGHGGNGGRGEKRRL